MKLLPDSIKATYPSYQDRINQEKMIESINKQLFNIIYPKGLPKGDREQSLSFIVLNLTNNKNI